MNKEKLKKHHIFPKNDDLKKLITKSEEKKYGKYYLTLRKTHGNTMIKSI